MTIESKGFILHHSMGIDVTYISIKSIHKKERVTEHVDAKLSSIRYKNSKNRIVKFDARKKLRVEVVFKVKRAGNKYKTVISTSYGLPARKRKRPVSEKIIHNQIQKKHLEKIKRGHLITSQTDPLHGLYAWTYFYQDKTKAEKAKARREKRAKMKKAKKKTTHKGSRNERRKTR